MSEPLNNKEALLSNLCTMLLDHYKGAVEGANKVESNNASSSLDTVSQWIRTTPGAMDLIVELSNTKPAISTGGDQGSMAVQGVTSATGPSEPKEEEDPQTTTAGNLSMPTGKPPLAKRLSRPPMMSVPEHAPATMPQDNNAAMRLTVANSSSSSTITLDDLVNEIILLLANTQWMCASLAQILPLLKPESKSFIRQQQVTQGNLISAAHGDLTLVTGTDIVVYTGSVDRLAALLQQQPQQQPQTPLWLTTPQQQFVVASPLFGQSPFSAGQGGYTSMISQGGILASPLPPQQTIQQAMRLQAAQAVAAAGSMAVTPQGLQHAGIARPIPGPGQTQPKRGVLDMDTLSSSPQLAALVKEVSFLLLTAGGPSRQLLLSELGTRISTQSRVFLKLNRTRLGQLLLRFPKDFLIEGQKASGKVTLIRPEVIQCPSTPVPLEKDLMVDNNVPTDNNNNNNDLSDAPPPGMSSKPVMGKSDVIHNTFSQTGGFFGAPSQSGPIGASSTTTVKPGSYQKNTRLADLGSGLSVDVAGALSRIQQQQQQQQGRDVQGSNSNTQLYLAPQQLISSPLPLVSPGTALGMTPFSAVPRSVAEGVLQTPALGRQE
ncbi:hypothetical protein FOL47_008888 [Perkinsus chesapeaki]|uniref:Uncharacterized protein n=1 Tax=Perkinsus chesapeaki TaxID=330153 RepID=A0A7J6LBN3_PERCH|nr:hypothetical protein FOL47_008888 [Perkinsus chesapeaki]